MKKFILSIILLFLIYSIQAQDIIYKKDGSAISSVRVREITVNVIKYKRTDIKGSPIYEIKKDEVYKIKHKKGAIDIIDPVFYKQKGDSIEYSLVYIVFDPGHTYKDFPLVINEKFLGSLSGQSRVLLKILTEGERNIYRETLTNKGPLVKFVAVRGEKYAIKIGIADEKAHDPNKKFSMKLYENNIDVADFIKNEYNKFTPDKSHDFFIEVK